MNIANHLERTAQRNPSRPAIVFQETSISYGQLANDAHQLAAWLAQHGIRQGDRVALLLPNIPAFMIGYIAAQMLGAIAVSLNTMLKADELHFTLDDSGATALITTADLLQQVPRARLPNLQTIVIAEGKSTNFPTLDLILAGSLAPTTTVDLQPNAPAAIVYSSGTTGFPKGVTLSHNNVVTNMAAKEYYCGIRPDDRLLLFVPLFHCFGQNAIMNSAFYAGATIILQRGFDFDQLMRVIQHQQVTMFFSVPTIYRLLLQRCSPEQFGAIRYWFSGAAPLDAELAREWLDRFARPIAVGYGLSETSPFASYNHIDHYKPGSIGVPITDVAMRIVDVDTRQPLATGEIGEIEIRGPNVMLGYWNRPADTAAVLTDGWFHSGDLGFADADGYFFIVDRLKDMINIAGLKVYPAEVEQIIRQHPAVADVAVYGVPDQFTGEHVEAAVVLAPNQQISAGAIMGFCRPRLASYKLPSVVHFRDTLPRNPTGKILKRVLRDQATGHVSEGS